MSSLVNIVAELATIEQEVAANHGELPQGSDLERRWESAQGALMTKVDAYAEYIMSLQARAEKLREAAKGVIARAAAMDSLAERLRRNAERVMGDAGQLEGETFKLVRRHNPPAVVIDEGQEWRIKIHHPDLVAYGEPLAQGTFQIVLDEHGGSSVVPIRIDKKAVLKALKEGRQIDGARLSQGTRVEIR